jgi:hypothetical protein
VVLAAPGLEAIFQPAPPATIEEVFAALSHNTLQAILAEMPEAGRFVTWKGKIRQTLALRRVEIHPVEPVIAQTV